MFISKGAEKVRFCAADRIRRENDLISAAVSNMSHRVQDFNSRIRNLAYIQCGPYGRGQRFVDIVIRFAI